MSRRVAGLALVTCFAVTPLLHAQTSGPNGGNHQAAILGNHTGLQIPVGIVEFPDNSVISAVNATHTLGISLQSEWDFDNVVPGGNPADASTQPGANHTTLVAHVVAGGPYGTGGVVPYSLVYTAALDDASETGNSQRCGLAG